MLVDPGLDPVGLADAVRAGWAVEASDFTFVPGYDMRTASYAVATGGAPVFLKVRFGVADDAVLEVPSALHEAGVSHVLAPIRTLEAGLRRLMGDDRSLVLYPFASGRDAAQDGLTADQWRMFGATLRAVHDSGLEKRFADRLPVEGFGLAAAIPVRHALAMARAPGTRSPSQDRLTALLREQTARIEQTLRYVAGLARRLQGRSFTHVLCHADIHAANILVADDGGILLVDWDAPMLAPRERDLLFVIGSRIARDVEPHEEAWFFEGYGDVPVDRDALVYFRYERILEDIGEIARSVLGDEVGGSEASREWEVGLAEGFFAPGGDLETADR